MVRFSLKHRFPERYAVLSCLMAVITLSSCSIVKGLFGKEEIVEMTPQVVEELRIAYLKGDLDALQELIALYEDENQPLDIRIGSVRAMGESRHPMALQSLASYVKEAEALELELMMVSVDILGNFEGDPMASEALRESILSIDVKLRGLQQAVFKSLTEVSTEDKILLLLDVYERSRAAFQNTALMVSRIMGKMDRDEVIPVLVFLANDRSLDIKIRNRALDILAQKKDSPEVVDMFVEMLTDPTIESQIRDFALRTMKDVKEEQLILALLDTYHQGQRSYFSLLNTLVDALGNFDDPAVMPTLIEIALSSDLTPQLRIKAINNLASFDDPSVFEQVLPMLEEPENYRYYPHLIKLARQLGVTDRYKSELESAALVAQEKALKKKQSKE
ncbi:MAG: hypothetical protein V3U24_02575 [Candidatus Neomarinimicrobiota bacterium]